MRAKPNLGETQEGEGFVSLLYTLPYTQKIENAEASLFPKDGTKIFPAVASVKRYYKPDITVDGGRASFLTSKVEPAPFRCSGPHSPSKVEGVAGTIAMGRRLTTFGSNETSTRNVLR
jgi:hypothetical protein